MAFRPVNIFIDGKELTGYTDAQMSRSKDDVTGSFSVSIFFTYVPEEPVMVNAARGRQVALYVGGQIAFLGTIDAREGSGAHHGDPGTTSSESSTIGSKGKTNSSVDIGPNEYTVKLSARGMTKRLIDSSHQHPTTNMIKPTTKQVIEKLVEPFEVEIEWRGAEIKLDKVRFKDGARVSDEIRRLASENAYFVYETRDGKLRVTESAGPERGEDLILGDNILRFSAQQSENNSNSEIKVKGQLTNKEKWGEEATDKRLKIVEDEWVRTYIPLIIQHYGNGDDEALDRRAKFEANKRSAKSKEVTIEVFHVQSRTGQPWDIGTLHYVEIPPEGIFEEFECTGVSYDIKANSLTTTLTLSPPPTTGSSGASPGTLGNMPKMSTSSPGGRRAIMKTTSAPGEFPDPWTGPNLVAAVQTVAVVAAAVVPVLGALKNVAKATVPSQLPPSFEVTDDNRK